MLQIPVHHINNIYHIGTLNAQDKKAHSLEGNTLSVSLCPNAWSYIAKLGGNPLWNISHNTPLVFLDIYAFIAQQQPTIMAWAIAQKHGYMGASYNVLMGDEENKDNNNIHYMACDTLKEAIREISDPDALLITDCKHTAHEAYNNNQEVILIKKDIILHQEYMHTHRIAYSTNGMDNLAALYAETHFSAHIHGIWWNDIYNPNRYSAPRGGIFYQHLPNLTITPESSMPMDHTDIPAIKQLSVPSINTTQII